MTKAVIREIGKFHEDDRAQRLIDVFDCLDGGQLNVSYINSTSHIVAWHAHKLQTDCWICLKGSLKVGLAEPCRTPEPDVPRSKLYTTRFEYLSDKNFRVLEIPPGVFHGYRALEPGTILLYYTTNKYDPYDEFRAKIGEFGDEWDTQNK